MDRHKQKIKVTFLGTGTSIGVPIIACKCTVCMSSNKKDKRLRSSVMIETQGKIIVIDCGPDFRFQMLREDVSNIDAILFTHEHRDHIAGLDDVRAFNYIRKKKIPVYAERRVIDAIRTEFPYIFSKTEYKGAPLISINEIDEDRFNIDGIKIIPIRAMHHTLPVLGFRIGDFVYITDANFIETKELEKMKNAKVIVLNALRFKAHFSHFSVNEAVGIIKKLAPEKAYLTHLSHFIGLHNETNKLLPDRIELAYDGLVLNI